MKFGVVWSLYGTAWLCHNNVINGNISGDMKNAGEPVQTGPVQICGCFDWSKKLVFTEEKLCRHMAGVKVTLGSQPIIY